MFQDYTLHRKYRNVANCGNHGLMIIVCRSALTQVTSSAL